MTSYSASDARKNLFKLVDRVKETHEPVCIVGKRNSAYLVSEEDWRGIQETLYLMSIPGMRESLIEGMNTPVEEMDEDPGW
jgi:antitoxin YefM